MNWLVLTHFLSLGIMSYQAEYHMGPQNVTPYDTPSGTFQTTFGVEALFADHLFAAGSVQTWETAPANAEGTFGPMQSIYTFSVGARLAGIEIGWRHECDHISLSDFSLPAEGFLANRDELYMSFTGRLKVF